MSLRFWPVRVLPLPPIDARIEASPFGQRLIVAGMRCGKQSLVRAHARQHGGVVVFNSAGPVPNLRAVSGVTASEWRP